MPNNMGFRAGTIENTIGFLGLSHHGRTDLNYTTTDYLELVVKVSRVLHAYATPHGTLCHFSQLLTIAIVYRLAP